MEDKSNSPDSNVMSDEIFSSEVTNKGDNTGDWTDDTWLLNEEIENSIEESDEEANIVVGSTDETR